MEYVGQLKEPHQSDTDMLANYIHNWEHFLHVNVLDGLHYSDRYFLHRFLLGLHRVLKPLGQDIKDRLAPFNSPACINQAAPDSLRPSDLMMTIQQFALKQAKLHLTTKTPQALLATFSTAHQRSSGSPARRFGSLANRPSAPSPLELVQALATDELTALNPDEAYNFNIFALEHSVHSQSCYWCGATDHLMQTCPQASKASKDPRAGRVIRAFLSRTNGLGCTISQVATDTAVTDTGVASDDTGAGPSHDSVDDATPFIPDF